MYMYTIVKDGMDKVVIMDIDNEAVPLVFAKKEEATKMLITVAIHDLCVKHDVLIELGEYSLTNVISVFHGKSTKPQ